MWQCEKVGGILRRHIVQIQSRSFCRVLRCVVLSSIRFLALLNWQIEFEYRSCKNHARTAFQVLLQTVDQLLHLPVFPFQVADGSHNNCCTDGWSRIWDLACFAYLCFCKAACTRHWFDPWFCRTEAVRMSTLHFCSISSRTGRSRDGLTWLPHLLQNARVVEMTGFCRLNCDQEESRRPQPSSLWDQHCWVSHRGWCALMRRLKSRGWTSSRWLKIGSLAKKAPPKKQNHASENRFPTYSSLNHLKMTIFCGITSPCRTSRWPDDGYHLPKAGDLCLGGPCLQPPGPWCGEEQSLRWGPQWDDDPNKKEGGPKSSGLVSPRVEVSP